MADCQSCRDAGRKQPAHYIEDGGGICRWCRSGEQHPAEKAKQRDLEKLAAGTVALEVQMAAPKSGRPCGCGCSRFLRKDNKTGFISGHKTGQQPKMRAQGGRTDGRTDGRKVNHPGHAGALRCYLGRVAAAEEGRDGQQTF